MFLRSKDNAATGAGVAALDTMWALSVPWYGDRLDEPFVPKSIDTLQQLLTDVGLTGAFWQLRA